MQEETTEPQSISSHSLKEKVVAVFKNRRINVQSRDLKEHSLHIH